MALIKSVLKQSLFVGLESIFSQQSAKATSGDEQENPEDVIKQVANDMADVIANAVDSYIKSGDIIVGSTNIQVTSTTPGTVAIVAPLQPAKIK